MQYFVINSNYTFVLTKEFVAQRNSRYSLYSTIFNARYKYFLDNYIIVSYYIQIKVCTRAAKESC